MKSSVARAARDFFKDFDFLRHLKAKMLLACGRSLSPGQILSSSGAKSLPTFLMSGILNGGPKVYMSAAGSYDIAISR